MAIQKQILTSFCFCMLLCAFSGSAALADGMPTPETSTLDKVLEQIQNKDPVADTEPPPTPVELHTTTEKAEDSISAAEKQEVPAPPPVPVEPVTTTEVTEKKKPASAPFGRIVQVQPGGSFFGLSVGMYDPFTHGKDSASFNVEWQPGVRIAGVLQPIFGALATTQGSLMGYGGFGIPIKLGKRVMWMPSIAIGAYEEGDGLDLGRTAVYRIGGELSYIFDNDSRLGLNAHAITNGKSLERNDRTEVISIVYTTPLDILSGGKKKGALNKK